MWGDWWFSSPDVAQGDYYNSRVELVFQTADHENARSYATWIMDIFNVYSNNDYYEQGVYSWDEWHDGNWVTVTKVEYQTHIEWPLLFSDYNGIVEDARTYGGWIETLDFSDVDELGLSLWNGGDRFYQSFQAGWHHEIGKLSGTFTTKTHNRNGIDSAAIRTSLPLPPA